MHDLGGRGEPFPVGVAPGTIGQARARQPISVCDLDRVDSGGIERCGDVADLVGPQLVPDGVHAVAQGDVLDVEHGRVHPVTPAGVAVGDAATSSSPARSAAEVMISRFPA